MTIDPYQPPRVQEQQAATPERREVAGAIAFAMFIGGTVFLGTCSGVGAWVFGRFYRTPESGKYTLIVSCVCALLGIVTGAFVGRHELAKVRERTALRDSSGESVNQE